MPWREFGTTADTGIEVEESTLAELFKTAAKAFTELSTDITKLKPSKLMRIVIEHVGLDYLLKDWLDEFLYAFEVYDILPVNFKRMELVKVDKDIMKIDAEVLFAEWVRGKHESRTEIKAVTYHMLKVELKNDMWHGRVIFDI